MNYYTFNSTYQFFIDEIYLTEVDFFSPDDVESRNEIQSLPPTERPVLASALNDTQVTVSASPNPTKGIFEVQFNSAIAQAATITITNLNGRQVYQQQLLAQRSSQHLVDLTAATEGIYLLTVQTDTAIVTKQILLMK